MCGNFGLIFTRRVDGHVIVTVVPAKAMPEPQVQSQQLKQVSQILREMAANTEIRGGQAGGISAIEHRGANHYPWVQRVRAVARK